MNSYYKLLSVPTKEVLEQHKISCFDRIVNKYQNEYLEIISYINQCYNYQSPFIVEEKDWTEFLLERFRANKLPEYLLKELVRLEDSDIAHDIDLFLDIQKDNVFKTIVAKERARQKVLEILNGTLTTLADMKSANEMLNDLDEEINSIKEELRQEQKRFGNYKGFDAVKTAKKMTKINIANL